MIQVRFFKNGSCFTGFEIQGHSLFADYGNDIVCAAVSSAAIMAANMLTEVYGEAAQVDCEDGRLFLKGEQSQSADAVVRGLKLHLEQLAAQYPKHITVS